MLYLTALSLPRRRTYIILHRHKSQFRMGWTDADRTNYLDFLRRIEQLYTSGPAGLSFPRQLLEAVYDKSLSATQATNRVLPYYLACPKELVDRSFLLTAPPSEVDDLGLAGTASEAHGLRFVVIGKGTDKLQLSEETVQRATDLRGAPFTRDELSTIQGRSDLALVRAVSESDKEVAITGSAKIVAVPAEADVVLSRNASGEFVREVARVWA